MTKYIVKYLLLFFCFQLTLLYSQDNALKNFFESKNSNYYTYSAKSISFLKTQNFLVKDSASSTTTFFKSPDLKKVVVELDCKIEKILIKKGNMLSEYFFRLIEPKITLISDGYSSNLEALNKELIKPFYVSKNNQGKIVYFSIDSTISHNSKRIVKDLISRTQFINKSPIDRYWQAEEEFTEGLFSTKYTLKEESSDFIIVLRQISNKKSNAVPRNNIDTKKDHISKIILNKTNSINSILISESNSKVIGEDTLAVNGVEITMTSLLEPWNDLRDKSSTNNIQERSGLYKTESSLISQSSEQDIRRFAYTKTLGSNNWKKLIEILSKNEKKSEQNINELTLKFRSLLYLHPEYCDIAVNYLNNKANNSNEFQILLQALLITESFNATNALIKILILNQQDAKVNLEILPVLSTTNYPTISAIRELEKMIFHNIQNPNSNFRNSVQLALAGMINNLYESSPDDSDALAQKLIEQMKNEKDIIQKILVFGNLGSEQTLPYLTSIIENKNMDLHIRIEALSVLNQIRSSKVRAYLKRLINNSKEEKIKKLALNILKT